MYILHIKLARGHCEHGRRGVMLRGAVREAGGEAGRVRAVVGGAGRWAERRGEVGSGRVRGWGWGAGGGEGGQKSRRRVRWCSGGVFTAFLALCVGDGY